MNILGIFIFYTLAFIIIECRRLDESFVLEVTDRVNVFALWKSV